MRIRFQVIGVRLKGMQKCIRAFFLKPKTFTLKPSSRGFSLIEMIVSVALFAIVMLISVTALLALVDANRKARTLQSVVNNLNVALDGMVRSLRMGYSYRCNGLDPIGNGPASCPEGAPLISFVDYTGEVIVYQWDAVEHRLQVSRNGGPYAYLTAPEVEITEMKFYVVGTTPGDASQPKVVMVMKGVANSNNVKTSTTFSIQSTAVQRILDL